MTRWIIIDSHNAAYRAFYSVGGLSYQGESTGVIFGFINSLIRLERELFSDRFVFCFDYGKPKRRELLPEYKRQRREARQKASPQEKKEFRDLQRQIIRLRSHTLRHIGYTNIWYQKGYEADDIIASIVRRIPKNEEAVIVSTDEDLYQLLSRRVSIYRPSNKEWMTKARFVNKYHIDPEQWIGAKAIAGDSSDNIPGVPGVGMTTAIQYLRDELPPRYKKYKAIVSDEGQKIIQRNLKLVSLPYEGCASIPLSRLPQELRGWKSVLMGIGADSLLARS